MMTRFILNLLSSMFSRRHWAFPEFVIRPKRLLYEPGLVMSTVFLGRQGAGKTFSLAMELLEQIKDHPEQSFFIFDWSGGLIDTLLRLSISDAKSEEIYPRLVYDAMGGREINGEVYVMPMPEFSEKYDPEKKWLNRVEDQVNRVQRTIEALNLNLAVRNPTIGGRPIKNLIPNILTLANAITDEEGNSWQITEAIKLLNKNQRALAISQFGRKVGKTHEYFTKHHTGKEKLDKELEHSFVDIMEVIKSQRIRARLGYTAPGWAPNEAIDKGLVVLCDGSGLNNHHMQKDYAYLQLFNLINDELSKRKAAHYDNAPINWVLDEVYTFFETPSIAIKLAHLPTEFRSRKLHLFLVLQTMKQLAGGEDGKKGLQDVFFSFGNMVVFSLLDIDDCFDIARNFFPFEPGTVKVPARRDGQHDIMENRDEQLAVRAYQLQHLLQRECYVRRFSSEAKMDRIIHIGRTREIKLNATHEDVEQLKDRLMTDRGVEMEKVRKIINSRKLSPKKDDAKPDLV